MDLKTLSRRTLMPSAVAIAGLLGVTAASADIRPIQIQHAKVTPQDQFELFGNLAYESNREPGEFEYDNLRIGPIGARYGVIRGLEIGGHLTYNSNSGDSNNDPDDAGLEALVLFGKIALVDNVSVEGGVRLAGADDVGPYPMDGIDFYMNLAAEQRVGADGKIYGEFGYTIQDNDGFGGTYQNWGIGYGHRITPVFALNVELVGDSAPNNLPGPGFGNHMDLVLGANFNLQQVAILKPFVSVGVYDASPDVAIGLGVDMPL
ncbi:hypothetical protein J2T57_002389 [Natronocella acetinitrilica]|uniref:Transporter n=1 Tax=Natronocella acetinitrilica TaxID=414046 RepID=A0AAE3G3Q5_9GAMM|nr:hypothetical protein [Natronocella acetinitrilica]MCP1675241.1 hypothetical protein [Natronocella acetinitrilica]